MPNVKPLSNTKRYKRLVEKYNISESEQAEQVEYFWKSRWPLAYFKGFSTPQIIEKILLPWLVYRWKNIIAKTAREARASKRRDRKIIKAITSLVKQTGETRKYKYVHKIIIEARKFRYQWATEGSRPIDINKHLPKHTFNGILRYIDLSDRQIKRKVAEIIDDILQSAEIKNNIEYQPCEYCYGPLVNKRLKPRSEDLKRMGMYTPLKFTPLTQELWATNAELKGYKKWRAQMKLSEEKLAQEEFAKEQHDYNPELYKQEPIKGRKTVEDEFYDTYFTQNTGLENDGRWDA